MSTLGTLSLIASQLCPCAPGKDGCSSQAAANGSVEGGRRNSDEWDLFQPSDVEDVRSTTAPWSGALLEFIFGAEVSEATLCMPALRVKWRCVYTHTYATYVLNLE